MGYCILHNGRMCSELEGRYLHMRSRCLQAADLLGALSYEAQAPLKMHPRSFGQDRACESISAYLQVRFRKAQCILSISFPHLRMSPAPALPWHDTLLTVIWQVSVCQELLCAKLEAGTPCDCKEVAGHWGPRR